MIRPTKGNVLVIPEKVGPHSDTIIIPETVMEKDLPQIGKVFAIGGKPITKKGVVTEPEFKVNDRVLFRKFEGLFVDFMGKRYFQIRQHHVLAVLE